MFPLSALLGNPVCPETMRKLSPKIALVTEPLRCPVDAKAGRRFECGVFNCLLQQKEQLGIDAIFEFKRLKVDGAIVLSDGRRLAPNGISLEIALVRYRGSG